jgi:hypothetical protein
MLTSTSQPWAQDSSDRLASHYHQFIQTTCAKEDFQVTLKSGQKLAGKCHAVLSDHFQIIHKGATHDIPYTNIEKISFKRSWFEKIKDAVGITYVFIKAALGKEDLFPL